MGLEEKEMKHFPQTRETNCGQTCIAIIEQRPIEEIERLMGKRGSTRPADLRRVLTRLGWGVTRPRRDKLWPLIQHGVLMIRGDHRMGHFVVKKGNWIYDPGHARAIRLRDWIKLLGTRDGGWRVTSHFKVWGKAING